MSEKDSSISVSTTPNVYADAALDRVQQLRKWREEIPHFAIPENSNAMRRLSPAASVPPEFVELTNMAVANETALVRGDGPTPAKMRELVAYADAYDPVADELEALASFLRYSTTAARHFAGTEALTTYSMAKRLSKRTKYAHLKPHVADMRRALGRVKRSTPEEIAQRLAQRADAAAARVAAKAAKTKPPATS